MSRLLSKKTIIQLASLVFIVLAISLTVIQVRTQQQNKGKAATSTDPNLKVAFIGDDGSNNNSKAVLNLIKSEGAAFVIDGGDLDYKNNPTLWDAQVTAALGANYPYFVSVGNHDVAQWPGYRQKLQARLTNIPGLVCDSLSDVGNKSTCKYRGLYFILSGIGAQGSKTDHEAYIKNALALGTGFTWKICSWHHNQAATQIGGKGDAVGWTAYEDCRKAGAIIANAHEHSYERTKTLIDIQNQIVDPNCNLPNFLCVALGKTFLFVSGLGGESIRVQARCLPANPPYGCKGEWAKIYTSNQSANYGALFIVFNYQGNPNKAHGYFKTISGQIVDEFDITTDSNATPPPGTPTPTPNAGTPTPTVRPGTPTPTRTPTPTPTRTPTPRPGTPTPTRTPTPSTTAPTATPTPGANSTIISLNLKLHGIGKGGDNANPTSNGNPNPVHTQKTINVTLLNSSNQTVTNKSGTIIYQSSPGVFTGTVNLGNTITSGVYGLTLTTDKYLTRLVPIQTINAGQTNAIPQKTLVVGDINGDNKLSILDYSILIGCLTPASSCNSSQQLLSDLDDNGTVDQFDYNLFLRDFSVQNGD